MFLRIVAAAHMVIIMVVYEAGGVPGYDMGISGGTVA
jgi:hypothetical protein